MVAGFVVIGRNEGQRLVRCLDALRREDAPVVYVDSGSSDGSRDVARARGAEVVELDLTRPFSMARARNAGYRLLRELRPDVTAVHFVDGDCELAAGWLRAAAEALAAGARVAAVCGRRRERFPEHSRYNRLCDVEWNTPVGPARSCGGDVLMRTQAFDEAGGYRDELIAGEEPELCVRLRARGWTIQRLGHDMTWHDANILRFSQWWTRNVRGGYGALDVVTRLRGQVPTAEVPFLGLTTSAVRWTDQWAFGVIWCAVAGGMFAGVTGAILGVLIPLGLWGLQVLRIARRVRTRAGSWSLALEYGVFTMVGKWAQRSGQRRYRRDVRAGKVIQIIEYKA